MNIFLSHSTALSFWRSSRSLSFEMNRPYTTAQPGSDCAGMLKTIESLNLAEKLGQPIDIMAASPCSRSKRSSVRIHLCSALSIASSFVRVEGQVYVASPELVFVQMAETLSTAQLIDLGYELCGTYRICPSNNRGFADRTRPVTSQRRIEKFVSEASGVKGVGKARRAARYILDNAASPMESKLAMCLCLPPLLGGYGFPPPQMNRRIPLSDTSKQRLNADHFEADLYWENTRSKGTGLAVEYDSDDCHTGSQRIFSDAVRRNALLYVNVNVFVVSRMQIKDVVQFDRSAHEIARILNLRLRRPTEQQLQYRRQLRTELFPFWR